MMCYEHEVLSKKSWNRRLLRIHLARKLMRLSSTLRTSWLHHPRSSSTLCTILTVKEQILSVDIHSVSVRVFPLLFLMVSGLTSLIMMHLLNLSSLLRGTLGRIWWWSVDLFCTCVCSNQNSLHVFRYVDAVMTIPKGTLFPMCGMNLGFNRELIGPAMYFGLMGDGQPIGRYDDMWAGWCTKVYIIHRI